MESTPSSFTWREADYLFKVCCPALPNSWPETPLSALTAVSGGAEIVLVESAKIVLPYVFAVSREIQRFQDLKTKIVGISQIGGRAGEIARMVVKNNGLDPDRDVTYLAVGGTMSRLAALSGGRIQAAPIS